MMMITASNERMVIGDQYGPSTTLTVKNIVKSDTMALQCNVTNYLIGSWVHTSFYLNVQCKYLMLYTCTFKVSLYRHVTLMSEFYLSSLKTYL